MDPLDLRPSAVELARLIEGTADADLDRPTPCEDWTVEDLLQHIRGFASASAAAAQREPFDSDEPAPTSPLAPTWKHDLPEMVAGMAEAWTAAEVWSGMTDAGAIELPAEVAGNAALQELVLHGWDLARATGQKFNAESESVENCLTFVSGLSEDDRSRPFADRVYVPHDSISLDQLLGLTGRNPYVS